LEINKISKIKKFNEKYNKLKMKFISIIIFQILLITITISIKDKDFIKDLVDDDYKVKETQGKIHL
jgi:hypothetical protein